MSALPLLEVGTQEPCSKGVHNVFLRINFGCHGSQRLKSEPFYIFLQPFFFLFHFLFCFYLSCFGEFGRIKFFLAISQNQQAPFCHESPPRTRRDRSRRLRGRTYGNTSLMLRIVRRVLVLRRVFKTCVRAAGDL